MSEQSLSGHLELLFPSKYVKCADLHGKQVTVVIDKLTKEDLVMAGGKKERKVVVHLRSVAGKKLEKVWVVGKTVTRQISEALGGEKDVAKWTGGKITMYPTTCRGVQGGMVECIRVRVKVNQAATEIPADMAAAPDPEPVAFLDAADASEATGSGS